MILWVSAVQLGECTQGTKGLLETAARSALQSGPLPQATPPALDALPAVAPSSTPGRPKASRGRQVGASNHRHHSQHRSKGKKTPPPAPHPPRASGSPASAVSKHSHSSRNRKDLKSREPKMAPQH
ncbi:uncharacterized protein LOC143517321 [Brachyhypopomus gauderio]|uniref:uncharacterized protein LOC143517321 n=1 Tax=Brachyhypopomus gauderio TaxID=698409 RepID=UPI0040433103